MASSMGQPVLDGVLTTLPATIELATLSLLIGASLGILCGVLCARYAGTPFDFIIRTLTLLGNSVPVFWLGLLMLLLFYATLQWSPGGRLDDIYQYTVEAKTGFVLIDTGCPMTPAHLPMRWHPDPAGVVTGLFCWRGSPG